MDMDCNLKKLANFSKFFLCIGEITKKLLLVYSFLTKSLNICHSGVRAILFWRKFSLSNVCAVLAKIQQNLCDRAPLILCVSSAYEVRFAITNKNYYCGLHSYNMSKYITAGKIHVQVMFIINNVKLFS